MGGRRPTRKEIAIMKVADEMGESARGIARKLNRSHHTVLRHLAETDFSDPEIQRFIARIKEAELAELHGIGGKARAILNDYLDDVLRGIREPSPIPVTAILDRTFQMRERLEGRSTETISYTAKLLEELERDRQADEKLMQELKARTAEIKENAGDETQDQNEE